MEYSAPLWRDKFIHLCVYVVVHFSFESIMCFWCFKRRMTSKNFFLKTSKSSQFVAVDISSTHCKRKTNELFRFQWYFVIACRWKSENKRTLVEFLMFIWPLKINWMNEYVRCSFAFYHKKKANYYPSLEYIRMYCLYRENTWQLKMELICLIKFHAC